ncbi:MAG: restriction endonuclease subunit S, partial [Candidatus Thorarchaeota archaeon]
MSEIPPNDWGKTALKNVANIRFSNVDKKTKPGERKVKLCNYIDVYNNEYITRKIPFMEATASISEIEKFSISEGDVLITKDSETPFDIGVPSVVSESLENVICGYHLAQIKPKRDEIDPVFLAKQLGSDRIVRYFAQQANGVTRYGLSTAAIENTSIWLPSTLDEQRTISQVLRNVDSIIHNTETKIDKLGKIKAGLMQDLLTKGIDENGQIRDPEKHPEQFKDSPLGIIPSEWDVLPCSEIMNLASGKSKTTKALALEKNCIFPVYGGNGITGFTSTPLSTLPTIVIGRVGEYCGCVHIAYEPSWITDNALYAKEISPEFDLEFLGHYLDWYNLKRLQSATGQPLVTQTVIDEVLIRKPKMEEQTSIMTRVTSVVKQIEEENMLHSKLSFVKQGLM